MCIACVEWEKGKVRFTEIIAHLDAARERGFIDDDHYNEAVEKLWNIPNWLEDLDP